MFKDTDRVWQQHNIGGGDNLATQRNAFMQFTPPTNASVPLSTTRKKSTKSRNQPKVKLQLHFDMELVTRSAKAAPRPTSTTDFPPLPSTRRHTRNGKPQATDAKRASSIDPEAAAAALARKESEQAMKIGQAAIMAYPPTALEKLKHGGKFYTTQDHFGNKFPVVPVGSEFQPLTMSSLLASRQREERVNHEIIPCGFPDEQPASPPAGSKTKKDVDLMTATTPLIKNARGTPPKFNRYLGNIFGAKSTDTDRQFWRRPPGSMLEDPNPPGFKDPHPPGWAPPGWVPDPEWAIEDREIAERHAAEDRERDRAQRSQLAHLPPDDPMEADDDDTTVLSDNLSVASPQQLPPRDDSASAQQGRTAARLPGFLSQNAPRTTTPAPSTSTRKFTWANTVSVPTLRDRIQHSPDISTSQDVTAVIAKISSDHRTQMAAQREAHEKAATILRNKISDLQNTNQVMNATDPPEPSPTETSTQASTEPQEFVAALSKMHSDHRLDIEEQKEENKKLRLQITELQCTITELLHRLSQPKKALSSYDTGTWDSDDELAAELSYATPMKIATPSIVVKRRGKALSPSKVSIMDRSAEQPSAASSLVERKILEGKKKARISTSPETKSMNPYQVLADDADTESVVSTNDEIVVIDSGNESGQETPNDPDNVVNPNTSVAQSDDLNISYGTVPDDADSFVDSLADSIGEKETELEPLPSTTTTSERDPPAKAKELAALMITRLAEVTRHIIMTASQRFFTAKSLCPVDLSDWVTSSV